MKFRMISIPSNGPTQINEIYESEANALYKGAFMRRGNVTLSGIENGFRIKDSNGEILVTAILETNP